MIQLNPKKITRLVLPLEKDLPENEQTIFYLATLTVEQESEIMDSLFTKDGRKPYRQYDKAFEIGVVNVENLIDLEGKIIPYEPTKEFICKIPRSVRDEVALRVLQNLERTIEDTKNLQS